MRVGRLRHRVELQEATETRGDYGDVTREWSTIATRWAGIEPMSGREIMQADQVNAKLSHRVRMRYDADVTPAKRLKFGSRIFDISSVINRDEKNAELEVLCSEAVD